VVVQRESDKGKRVDKLLRENSPVPQAALGSEGVGIGIVKWWSDAKGYGAIAVELLAPWDVWCHFSNIEGDGYRSLAPGEAVEVVYIRSDQESFKYIARVVRRTRQISDG
jgi:cold shock protein